MKKLEKSEIENLKGGGYNLVCSFNIFSTNCVETTDKQVCVGTYTWGGRTKSLVCHSR